MPEPSIDTRAKVYSAQQFIDDPTLFQVVEDAWRSKNWFALVGEWPIDGRVMAVVLPEGGVKFWWRHVDDT
jgi:hypothetical protein